MTHTDEPVSAASVRERIVQYNWTLVELGGLITLWYAVFGSRWSGFVVPMGGEYARSMHSFYTWDYLRECGECAWWSNIIGGYPNFAELFGSFVHPIAFISSMLWGAVAGSAMTVAMAFLLIMLAGWWLAFDLKLHPIARLWYAMAVMLGGHMMSRLEIGSVGMPLSIASAWLFIVLLIGYIHTPSRIRALVLGMAAGALLLAGQGYLQFATALSLPLWAWYAYTQDLFRRHASVWRDAFWVLMVGLLIAAPIYVATAMTSGLYEKEFDLSGKFNLSMTQIIVNLFLDDFEIAKSDVYNNFAYPWAYSTYIGVTAFVFAVAGYQWLNHPRLKALYRAFALFTAGAVFFASGYPIAWIIQRQIDSLSQLVGGLRYIVLLNAFVALGVLTMALLSIHGLMTTILVAWPKAFQRFSWIPVKALLVGALLISNLQSMSKFGHNWLDEIDRYEPQVAAIIDDIKAQPFGHIDAPDWMTIPLMSNNLKISRMIFSWWLVDYEFPTPSYILSLEPRENTEVITQYENGWTLYRNLDPQAVYAQVIHNPTQSTQCQVDRAVAGIVDLTCTTTQPGVLVVQEHDMPDWNATVNGNSLQPSVGTGWLTLELPSGTNVIQFRYQPWYVVPSLMMSVIGWALALGGIIYLLLKKTPTAR
jgi:hypothetical protein